MRLLLFASRLPTPSPPAKCNSRAISLPILSTHCFTCHGPDAKTLKAGLRIDVFETATRKLKSGHFAVVPGNAKDSELLTRIFSADESERMPPKNAKDEIMEGEKSLLKRWIEEGAEYQRHWAFVVPKRPALPSVKNKVLGSQSARSIPTGPYGS